MFRIQAYDSRIYGHFCSECIKFMFGNKNLNFTGLTSLF